MGPNLDRNAVSRSACAWAQAWTAMRSHVPPVHGSKLGPQRGLTFRLGPIFLISFFTVHFLRPQPAQGSRRPLGSLCPYPRLGCAPVIPVSRWPGLARRHSPVGGHRRPFMYAVPASAPCQMAAAHSCTPLPREAPSGPNSSTIITLLV
jgi:hypothetical protein